MPVLTSGDHITMSVPYPFPAETGPLPGELPPAQTLDQLSKLATTAALSQLTSESRPPMLPQLKSDEEKKKTDFDDIQWNERDGTLPKREPNKSGINDGDSGDNQKENGSK
ncbi:MAG TPA: hypothetical protein VLH86_02030 [Patescibacteria group bacterium]|nr:hypothetical protein [Patescibacteria group bacterium]